MSRRLVDTAIYQSDKLYSVPEEFRQEYAWIIPMASSNGCMEYNVPVIWSTGYALMRPSVSREKLQKALEAFIEAKLLFSFTHSDGKKYIFFVGMERKGLLPCPTERAKYADGKSIVPAKELAKFLNLKLKDVEERFVAVLGKPLRGVSERSATCLEGSQLGIGIGDGNAAGKAEAEVQANAKATATVMGNGHGQAQDKAQHATRGGSTSVSSGDMHDPATQGQQGNMQQQKQHVIPPADQMAVALADQFREMVKFNPHCKMPSIAEYRKIWAKDFDKLLALYSYQAVIRLMQYSQVESQQQFNVRAAGLVKNHELLADKFKIPTLEQEANGMRIPAAPPKPVTNPTSGTTFEDDDYDGTEGGFDD